MNKADQGSHEGRGNITGPTIRKSSCQSEQMDADAGRGRRDDEGAEKRNN